MNHARGDMRADCGLVECRGAGGGQGEKFDGRRPAVSPERQAKKNQSQNQNQNHSGGVATWSEEAVVRFFSGEGWAVESLTLSLEQRTAMPRQGNWEIGGARTSRPLAVKSEKSATRTSTQTASEGKTPAECHFVSSPRVLDDCAHRRSAYVTPGKRMLKFGEATLRPDRARLCRTWERITCQAENYRWQTKLCLMTGSVETPVETEYYSPIYLTTAFAILVRQSRKENSATVRRPVSGKRANEMFPKRFDLIRRSWRTVRSIYLSELPSG